MAAVEARLLHNIYIYIYAQDAWFAVGWKANFLRSAKVL